MKNASSLSAAFALALFATSAFGSQNVFDGAVFATDVAQLFSGEADAVPELSSEFAEFQRDIDATEACDYELFRAGGPDLAEHLIRMTHEVHPGLKRYDDAFDKVFAEVQTTVVTSTPAVWLVYDMGIVVKTPKAVFAIDLAHRKGLRMEPLLDFALVTHNHDDHVDEALLDLMNRNRKTVVSNFLPNYGAHRGGGTNPGGYSRGERTLQVADATIRVTPSDHNDYLENFTSAFEITVGDWTLYHSGDSSNIGKLSPTHAPDLWIVHPLNGVDVAEGVRKFHPKCTAICHLCELGHRPGRWRWTLADGFNEAARAAEAGTEAVVPLWGERIR